MLGLPIEAAAGLKPSLKSYLARKVRRERAARRLVVCEVGVRHRLLDLYAVLLHEGQRRALPVLLHDRGDPALPVPRQRLRIRDLPDRRVVHRLVEALEGGLHQDPCDADQQRRRNKQRTSSSAGIACAHAPPVSA